MARQREVDQLGQVAKIGVIPAPTGGWNARDPLADLAPNDAIILDNFIPGTGGVSSRPGNGVWATGLGASVKSLMQYYGQTGSPRLFGAAGANLYDVTSGGAAGAAVQSGLGSAYWQSLMFSTPGGSFLVACNDSASDGVRNFDGTNWTTPTITPDGGVVLSTSFLNVGTAANRLWFVQKNSLVAWYLDTQAISGSAHPFDLRSAGAKKGGYLVAIGNWTQDGGAGSDDLTVFLTNRGEAFIYSGSDPSSTTTWSKIGTFKLPPPIGFRCLLEVGADLAVNTIHGTVPLSSILALDAAASGRVAFTDKIRGAFISAFKATGTVQGWEMIDYPAGQISLVNVPNSDLATSNQFVMNSVTGAWCRFTGLNAICWSMLGDSLYYGKSDGTVHQYDAGTSDAGTPISGVVMPAFSAFSEPLQKQFLMAQPLYTAASGSNPPLTIKTDYDVSVSAPAQPAIQPSGTPWGSPWGSPWTRAQVSIAQWQGVSGIGRMGTVQLSVSLKTSLTLQQTLVLYAPCENALGG